MSKKNDLLLKIAIAAVAIFAMVMLLVLRLEINNLQKEQIKLSETIDMYESKISDLEEKLKMTDPEFSDSYGEDNGSK